MPELPSIDEAVTRLEKEGAVNGVDFEVRRFVRGDAKLYRPGMLVEMEDELGGRGVVDIVDWLNLRCLLRRITRRA